MHKKIIILSIGIFSGLLWGLNDVFTKVLSAHETLPILSTVIIFSLVLAWFQDACSAIGILSARSVKNDLKSELKQSRPAWRWLLIAAIFAGPLGMVAGIIGIDYAGPVYAGSITSCYPIITLILAVSFLKEKLTLRKLLGVIFAVASTIAISILGEHSNIQHISLGIFFAAVAMIGWGMESVLLTIAYKRSHSNMALLLALRQVFSSSSYLILLLILFLLFPNVFSLIKTVLAQPLLLFLCIITAWASYMAYYYFIKFVGASLATLFNATFIFWAAFFSWLGNISPVAHSFWIWALLLVVGLYFAES